MKKTIVLLFSLFFTLRWTDLGAYTLSAALNFFSVLDEVANPSKRRTKIEMSIE